VNYDTALDYIKTKILEERKAMEEFISQGSLKDIAEYAKLCGVIQGLDRALGFISDLATRMEHDEDE
jgi:hypothetical protein